MSSRFPFLVVLVVLLFGHGSPAHAEGPRPLFHAHAHNDYYHKRPLLDALDLGFGSIEADVFLVDDQLLVGHAPWELQRDRTLESLYLKPLQERIAANEGQVYSQPGGIILLVDIKNRGAETFAAVDKLLSKYSDIVSVTQDGKHQPKAVTVIISGDRAKEEIAQTEPRYAGIDGRISDLDSDAASDLVPLISDHWPSHFTWKGEGEMPEAERAKLKSIVDKAHAQGRLVRFWATPENPRLWKELREAGVDLIGTDQLENLARFLNADLG